MLHSHEYEKSCQAAGKDSLKYQERMGFLKSKWPGNDDSEAMRLISSVIYRPTFPIYYAVITDNLDYFKDNYKNSKLDLQRTLAIACLCGSRQIGDFLFNEMKLSYSSPECGDVLPYLAASDNMDWIKDVVASMMRDRASIPDSAFTWAGTETARTIFRLSSLAHS